MHSIKMDKDQDIKVRGEEISGLLCIICEKVTRSDSDCHCGDGESERWSSSASAVKILLTYLLNLNSSSSLLIRSGKEEILSSFKNGKSSICAECLSRARKLQEHHLHLETIQMQILDVLRNLQDYLKSSSSSVVRKNQDDDLPSRFKDILRREFLCRDFSDGTQVRLELLSPARYPRKISSFVHVQREETEKSGIRKYERRKRLKREPNANPSSPNRMIPSKIKTKEVFAGSEEGDFFDTGTSSQDDPEGIKPVIDFKAECHPNPESSDEGIPDPNDQVAYILKYGDGNPNDCHDYLRTLPSGQRFKLERTFWDCDICLESIPAKEMKLHLNTHPDFEKFYECGVCPPSKRKRIYGTYKGLIWHYLRIPHKANSLDGLPCLLCPTQDQDQSTLFRKTELLTHLYEFHQLNHKKLPCKEQGCPEEFYSPATRNAHFNQEHCGKQLQCPSCPKVFKNRIGLLVHRKTHQKGYVPEMVQCDQCTKMILKTNFPRHLRVMHAEEEVEGGMPCDLCKKRMKSETRLALHMQRVHGEEAEGKVFHCPQCSKECRSERALRYHVKMNHVEADVVMCPHCPNMYSEFVLNNHIRSVHLKRKKRKSVKKEKPEKVPKPKLKVDRQYQCSDCPYMTKGRGNFYNHRKLHNGTAYKCQFCTKLFTTRKDLLRHEATHSKFKPFQCHLCPTRFMTVKAHDRHRKAFHPNNLNLPVEVQRGANELGIRNLSEKMDQ